MRSGPSCATSLQRASCQAPRHARRYPHCVQRCRASSTRCWGALATWCRPTAAAAAPARWWSWPSPRRERCRAELVGRGPAKDALPCWRPPLSAACRAARRAATPRGPHTAWFKDCVRVCVSRIGLARGCRAARWSLHAPPTSAQWPHATGAAPMRSDQSARHRAMRPQGPAKANSAGSARSKSRRRSYWLAPGSRASRRSLQQPDAQQGLARGTVGFLAAALDVPADPRGLMRHTSVRPAARPIVRSLLRSAPAVAAPTLASPPPARVAAQRRSSLVAHAASQPATAECVAPSRVLTEGAHGLRRPRAGWPPPTSRPRLAWSASP